MIPKESRIHYSTVAAPDIHVYCAVCSERRSKLPLEEGLCAKHVPKWSAKPINQALDSLSLLRPRVSSLQKAQSVRGGAFRDMRACARKVGVARPGFSGTRKFSVTCLDDTPVPLSVYARGIVCMSWP
jgi:hypothetical protein